MSKLTLAEKVLICAQRGEPLPLNGHTMIVLADPITGKPKEVVESDNMITNAVASILANNYEGASDFSLLMPLRKLFGGVLLFQNALTENANNYNIPSEIVSPQIAHAGDLANDTESLLRGSPVPADFEYTDTSIKQVWFWPTTHGNGTIKTVCLCPNTMGNMGTKPFNDQFSPYSGFGIWKQVPSDDVASKEAFYKYPIRISDDGQYGFSLWISGTTFYESKVRHDYTKFGIMRTQNDWQLEQERTATIRTFNLLKSSVFETDTHYWIYEITSATTLKIDKVSKEDMSVTQNDCTFSGIAMSTSNIGISGKPLNIANPRFGYDGTYLYLPNSTNNGFVAVNPNDNSDVKALDGTVNLSLTPQSYNNENGGWQGSPAVVVSSGFVVGGNYIINGNSVYQTKEMAAINSSSEYFYNKHYADVIRRGASVYTCSHEWYGARNVSRGSALLQTFLSTINNLDDEVVKTSARTMQCSYTLREA